MAVTEERPQRADARRNRVRIVKAAKAEFAVKGSDAQMDDIARRAKVGVGTVYRHFPTKEALIRALVADRVKQIIAFAREGLEDPDPWRGFESSLWRGAELGATDRALSQLFAERGGFNDAPQERDQLFELEAKLIKRGQKAGVIRKDLSVGDIPVIMCGVLTAMDAMSSPAHEGPWKRHLSILLDGMRAPAATRKLPSAG